MIENRLLLVNRKGAINFLLVGCGDLRHVLMTAARARQHTDAPLQVIFANYSAVYWFV